MRTRVIVMTLALVLVVFAAGCGTVHMGVGAQFNNDGTVNASLRLDTTGVFSAYVTEISQSMDSAMAAGWDKSVEGTSVVYRHTFASIDELNSSNGLIKVSVENGLFANKYHFAVQMPEDLSVDSLRASMAESGQSNEFMSTDDMVNLIASCISVGVDAQLPDGSKITATNAPQQTDTGATWNLSLSQMTPDYTMTLDWQRTNPAGYVLIAVAAVIAVAIYFSRRRRPAPAPVQAALAQPTPDGQVTQAVAEQAAAAEAGEAPPEDNPPDTSPDKQSNSKDPSGE